VPNPPKIVMLGRPNPSLALPSGLLMNASPPAAPYPTAGSVIGMTTGRNPYFSSRKPLTSSHPSSADRNFDGAAVASGVLKAVVSAPADASQSTTVIRIEIVQKKRIIGFQKHLSMITTGGPL